MTGRLPYIDAVKGVAIFCISLLHFEQGVFPDWLNTWIGLFMITTFYFTSGWVSAIQRKRYTAKEIFIKRFWQLGIPYFWFSILLLLFDIFFYLIGWYELKIVLRDLYKTMVFRGIGTLWFLPVLLCGETLFWAVRSHKHPWIIGAVVLGISVLATVLYETSPLHQESGVIAKLIDAPLRQVVRIFAAWQIVAIGYFAGSYWEKLLRKRSKRYLAGIGFISVICSIALIFISDCDFFSNLLSQTLPEFGMICLFFVMPYGALFRFFEYWGKNSLILMCTHFSIVMEFCMIFDCKVLHRPQFTGWLNFIYFIVAILVIWLVIPLFHGRLNFMLMRHQEIR